jgi:hypothetical protein
VSTLICWSVVVAPCFIAHGQDSVAFFYGREFSGGAKDLFFDYYENEQVNYVYARTNGAHATMRHTFQAANPLRAPLVLHVKARSDDLLAHPEIQLRLNGTILATGADLFPEKGWQVRKFPIPAGLVRAGTNDLVISNLAPEGRVGDVPWFMVAWCAVAQPDWEFKRDLARDFRVDLPSELRPFPEPLSPGQEPGFKIRGVKGYIWTPEQYLAEIPVLASNKMNFLMNCYGGLFASENWSWGEKVNRWWEPLPESKRLGLEKVVQSAHDHGVKFCFSINPQLFSPRPLNPTNDLDFEQLWQHFAWAQSRGVQWFNLALDDVEVMAGLRIDAEEHCTLANGLFARLRAKDPAAQMIFCGTWYMGDGSEAAHQTYLSTIARELHPDIYLFWTGDGLARITKAGAEGYKAKTKHRLFFWDNYPVNDNLPILNLAPVTGRDPGLCEVADGYMSNSMRQNQINRLPMMTCADYAYNPKAYDPGRSIGQAIMRLGQTREQRQLLKELSEANPGPLIYKKSTCSFNSLQERFQELCTTPHSRFVSALYLRHVEDLSMRLTRLFPNHFEDARITLDTNLDSMKKAFTARYGAE